jgi:hypothetical protein
MTDINTTPTTGNSTTGNRSPSHIAYQVRESKGDAGKKSYWTRIGSAWQHSDGNGFNIQIESVPLDGRITLRVTSETKA